MNKLEFPCETCICVPNCVTKTIYKGNYFSIYSLYDDCNHVIDYIFGPTEDDVKEDDPKLVKVVEFFKNLKNKKVKQ